MHENIWDDNLIRCILLVARSFEFYKKVKIVKLIKISGHRAIQIQKMLQNGKYLGTDS